MLVTQMDCVFRHNLLKSSAARRDRVGEPGGHNEYTLFNLKVRKMVLWLYSLCIFYSRISLSALSHSIVSCSALALGLRFVRERVTQLSLPRRTTWSSDCSFSPYPLVHIDHISRVGLPAYIFSLPVLPLRQVRG
jgi:hypothetical protein